MAISSGHDANRRCSLGDLLRGYRGRDLCDCAGDPVMAVSQCPHRVPPAMWAWISAPPRCRLTGPDGVHHGDHTARHVVPNVGKMAFRWKGMKRRQPPQVTLPTPTADHIQPANGRLV